MKFDFLKIITVGIVFCLSPMAAQAKVCTASTIIDALASSGKFIFANEGCSNTVISTSSPINVGTGKIIDGSNKLTMKWTGAHKCDEKPSNDTIFNMNGDSSKIANLTMDWSPEGIHMNGNNNIVDHLTYIKICEDGLTNYGNNNIIQNSLFQNAPDKCIQTNSGSAIFRNNTFRNCTRAIGSCSDKADPGNHPMANCLHPSFNQVINNKFYGPCQGYMIRASGKKSKKANGWLQAIGNEFTNCKGAMQSEEDGNVFARDNIINGGVAFDTEMKNGSFSGKIYNCKTTLKNGATLYTNKKPIEDCKW
jgi:uncharacterized protein with beta-barrel porin domain